MKKLVYITAFAFTAIIGASLAYGAKPLIVDLTGLWEITMDVVYNDGLTSQAQVTSSFVVNKHDGDLFTGFGCPQDEDRTNFTGILDGTRFHITSWDSLSIGTVNYAGDEMNGINQVQRYKEDEIPPYNASSTAKVVATKINKNKRSCP